MRLEPLDPGRHGSALWTAMEGHDAVWTYLAAWPPADFATYLRILAELCARPAALAFAVVDKIDGQPKGHLLQMEIRPEHGVWEVGYIAYAPVLQRTRAATEAILLCGDMGFSQGYRRFEWKCDDRNAPSKRAALRYGFTPEGLFRQHMVVKGENRDTAWFSILDHEWPSRRAAFHAWLDPANFDQDGRQLRRLSSFRL